jgi:hypothetical protein
MSEDGEAVDSSLARSQEPARRDSLPIVIARFACFRILGF